MCVGERWHARSVLAARPNMQRGSRDEPATPSTDAGQIAALNQPPDGRTRHPERAAGFINGDHFYSHGQIVSVVRDGRRSDRGDPARVNSVRRVQSRRSRNLDRAGLQSLSARKSSLGSGEYSSRTRRRGGFQDLRFPASILQAYLRRSRRRVSSRVGGCGRRRRIRGVPAELPLSK
jgi:hypothetical protein